MNFKEDLQNVLSLMATVAIWEDLEEDREDTTVVDTTAAVEAVDTTAVVAVDSAEAVVVAVDSAVVAVALMMGLVEKTSIEHP